MAWTSIVNGKEIGDVRADRRSSKGIEKYNISSKALYFDSQYLPVGEIKSLRVQPSLYTPHGCCGKGLPVFKIRVDYGGEKPVVLLIEKEANAEKAVAMLTEANPEIVIEKYVDPMTGEAWKKRTGIF